MTRPNARALPRPTAAAALAAALAAGGLVATPAAGQLVPDADGPVGVYPGPAYSPHAGRTVPARPLWGEMHLPTDLSMEAGGFGNRVGPRDAYRAARCEETTTSTGQPFRLSRPVDRVVIADHSERLAVGHGRCAPPA